MRYCAHWENCYLEGTKFHEIDSNLYTSIMFKMACRNAFTDRSFFFFKEHTVFTVLDRLILFVFICVLLQFCNQKKTRPNRLYDYR